MVDFSAIRQPVTVVSGTLLVVSLMAAATTTGSALDLTEHKVLAVHLEMETTSMVPHTTLQQDTARLVLAAVSTTIMVHILPVGLPLAILLE